MLRVSGLGFWIWGLRFWVYSLQLWVWVLGFGFWVPGLFYGFRIEGLRFFGIGLWV